ncbi:hypothetical protein BDZ97DRAFT_1754960 [Flammula alnicola]|nr:hypothetical protein BDZ97DRAFT_1754960 [Flammula alnicola]
MDLDEEDGSKDGEANDREIEQDVGDGLDDFEKDSDVEEDQENADEQSTRCKTPIESDPSGSDFSEAEKEAELHHLGRAKYCHASSPTIEEQDLKDDQEFDQVPPLPPSPLRFTHHQKGKGKEIIPETHRVDIPTCKRSKLVFKGPVLGLKKDCNQTGLDHKKTGPAVRSFDF